MQNAMFRGGKNTFLFINKKEKRDVFTCICMYFKRVLQRRIKTVNAKEK